VHVEWDANVVSDDDSDGYTEPGGDESDDETVAAHNMERRRADKANLSDLMRINPGLKARPAAIIDEDLEKLSCQDPHTEILRWHYRLGGHLSFKRIKGMSDLGIRPKRLAQVTSPNCAGCMYGAMTKKP
jgi:hypothetical protein